MRCFFFHYSTTGKNDIAVFFIQIHYFELQFFSDKLIKIGYWFQRHLATGKETFDAIYLYDHSAFYTTTNDAWYGISFFVGFLDAFDVFLVISFLFGKLQTAVTTLDLVDVDSDSAILLRWSAIGKFGDLDYSFTFEADVYPDFLIRNIHDSTFNDLAHFKI